MIREQIGRKGKKGAVELSLNLIIMLIIGLVVMGLVIAFVTGFLGEAKVGVSDALTPDDKSNIEQILRERGNFARAPSNIELFRGSTGSEKIYIKLANSHFSDYIFPGGEITETGSTLRVAVQEGNVEGDYSGATTKITFYGAPVTLKSGESGGYALDVYAGKEVPVGTYYATITAVGLYDGVNEDTVVVTIEVTI